MSFQTTDTQSSHDREKLTILYVIGSLRPSEVPQIPHTRELHSALTSNMKEIPLPGLGDTETTYQFEYKIFPKPRFAEKPVFK